MNPLEKEFVPYPEALELKQLSFDEPCFAYYDEEDGGINLYEYANCSGNVTSDIACYNYDFLSVTNSQLDEHGAFCAKDDEGDESFSRWTAPMYQQTFRWFREHTDWPIDSWIEPYLSEQPRQYEGFYWRRGKILSVGVFSTYDEAELNLLRKLIEIVKNK